MMTCQKKHADILKLRFIIVLLIVLAVLVPAFRAAQETGQAMTMMGLEDEGVARVWQDHLFFRRMADSTGITFGFEQFHEREAYQKRLDGLKAGAADLPQVLFKAGLSPSQAQELFERGVLVDLSPYLEEHMPAFSALMRQKPEIRTAITLPGGVIPALPFVDEIPGQNILWINRVWLDALNLPLPGDAKALKEVLAAFQAGDPNRNGRADEIPLSFSGAYDLKYLAQAWGLLANDFNVSAKDGEVRFLAAEKEFRGFIAWCADLYREGLLDNKGFTMPDTMRKVTDAKAANRYGAFFAPLPTQLVPLEWVGQYEALPPLAFEGKASARAVASTVFYGTFALTSACPDIPGMLSWADRLYTREGAVLAGIGLLGEDYVVDGDGTWRMTREAPDSAYYAQTVISGGYTAPGLSMFSFQKSYTDPQVRSLAEQAENIAAQTVLPFPDLPLTREQEGRLAPLQAGLGRYLDEAIARFVTGEWELSDARFADFESGLAARGLEEFLLLWQQIYDGGDSNNGV